MSVDSFRASLENLRKCGILQPQRSILSSLHKSKRYSATRGLGGFDLMNLPYTYALLSAADHQRYGFIKLRGSEADQEVRLMVGA